MFRRKRGNAKATTDGSRLAWEQAVAPEALERITSFYTSVGFAGSKQTLYYAEVDESMKRHAGGGIEDEKIEVIELPLKEAEDFIYDESVAKTPGLMFAFCWFFKEKVK